MTSEEAKDKYLEYLEGHIGNVQEALDLFLTLDIPFINDNESVLRKILSNHDKSKYDEPEWTGYLHHFYPISDEDSLKTEEFEEACSHHIKSNPHHWDYWIKDGKLVDDIDENEYKLYCVERCADWCAMSVQNGNSPLDWYNANKDYIIMPDYGYDFCEEILNKIPKDFDLSYHGTRTEGKPERENIDEHLLGLNRKYIKKLGKRAKIGNNGTAVSIKPTFSNLSFDEVIESFMSNKDNLNESTLLEVKASQLRNKTKSEDPARVKKSKNVKTTYIGMSKFGILNFKTTSESRSGYHYQTVEFQSMKPLEEVIKRNGKVTPDDVKKALNDQDLNVYCSDESFSYWAWYHQAYQNDYAYIDDNIPDLDKRLQAPKVNNVRLQGALCKHLYSVLEYITRPFVLLAVSDDINKYLKGEEDKYHQQTAATQNWYDAVKQWTSEDATEYLGMTKEQILADLSKTIKIDSEIDLDEYVDDLVKDAMKKNKNNPDPKLERQIADKVKEELDLEDEYNKMKPEEVDTDEENIE